MAWFQLNAASGLARMQQSARAVRVPCLGESVARGVIGFGALGVAGFLPWVLGLGRTLGEGGMYAVCAAVFLVLSGVFLHRLIIGPGSLRRFYPVFALGFGSYAIVWSAFWFAVKFPGRDYLGIVAGGACFAAVLCAAFGRWKLFPAVLLAIAGLQAGGYFAGAVAYQQASGLANSSWMGVEWTRRGAGQLARALWGVGYGVGFGAGLGVAFHLCQSELRGLIRKNAPANSSPGPTTEAGV